MEESPDVGDQQNALPDVEEKFAPGETTAVEGEPAEWGLNRQRIPQKYQTIFTSLCRKVAQRDQFARIEEVRMAAIQRFYWRNMMDVCWNDSSDLWEQPYNGQVYWNQDDASDVPLNYPLNIYQQFGRGFITLVSQLPTVKMQAKQINSPDAMRIANAADAMRKNIEAQNDMDKFCEDTARLFWTDGRVVFYSRWVTDGARFGYEDEAHDDESPEGLGAGGDPPPKKPRQPKGGEVITPHGVLEAKVPINARDICDWDWAQLSTEVDTTKAKSTYPWIGKNISAGEPGPGSYNFDRTTRIAITQGIRLLMESGDTTAQLPTLQRTFFRPSFFVEIDDDNDRAWFEDNYPDGAEVVFVGEKYCESRNCSMDDHLTVCHPLPGDGQATPSCGRIVVPVQDAVSDLTDLKMERAMKSIPAVYCDKEFVNLQAISKEKAGPGAHYPATGKEGRPLSDGFWPEPVPSAPADENAMWTQLFGPIPQALTGIYAAVLGEADTSNETAAGQQVARDQSKSQSGVAWRAFRKAYARSMMQLVRIGAYFRAGHAEEGKIKISPPGGEEIEIELEDLHDGNWWCFPDGDESYPETHSEKRATYQAFATQIAQTPQGQALINDPKNLILSKNLLGLGDDLEIPGADSGEKQMSEIKELLATPPIPNLQARMLYMTQVSVAQQQRQPVPPKPPLDQLFNPSVPIDAEFDDHQAELTYGTDWINSPEGQEAKRSNPEGFMNVRLHLLLHKAQLTQAQQQAQQQQIQLQLLMEKAKHSGQAKSPGESINFKDLGPSGQIQLGAQAGLDLRADAAASMAADQMGETQPAKTTKPGVQ
jgi:hypothetical protein